ncbi:TetR family transcriptional regulator [Streptacidiphilus sp. PAMC 29251]
MMATGTALDAETILAATEEVLRRYGPAKATVVDVARALGVSHAAVYRHFPSKSALREAVTRRWAARSYASLAAVAADTTLRPPERLRAWLNALFAIKRAKALDDPELLATYRVLVSEYSEVIAEHLAGLVGQVRGIVADGIAGGDFTAPDLDATALAVFEAATAYHHPAHVADWRRDGVEDRFAAICDLIVDGLRAR